MERDGLLNEEYRQPIEDYIYSLGYGEPERCTIVAENIIKDIETAGFRIIKKQKQDKDKWIEAQIREFIVETDLHPDHRQGVRLMLADIYDNHC